MLKKILACAALTPMLLACAPFAQAGVQPVSPQQVSLADATCTQVMGLHKGEYYFALCRESLDNTLAAKQEGQEMATAYEACRQQGLADGTAAFSTCMLDSDPPAPMPQTMAVVFSGVPGTEPAKSFYSIPPREQFQRERYSCAQLGLLPGSAPFGHCVADLQIAMLSNPD